AGPGYDRDAGPAAGRAAGRAGRPMPGPGGRSSPLLRVHWIRRPDPYRTSIAAGTVFLTASATGTRFGELRRSAADEPVPVFAHQLVGLDAVEVLAALFDHRHLHLRGGLVALDGDVLEALDGHRIAGEDLVGGRLGDLDQLLELHALHAAEVAGE